MDIEKIRQLVQNRYGSFACQPANAGASCCQAVQVFACCGGQQELYTTAELAEVPQLARSLSRGCGNPCGFAQLATGEIVVDLGCGGGIDLVLAARRVGSTGRVIGVDFTPEMMRRAVEVLANAGLAESANSLRISRPMTVIANQRIVRHPKHTIC